jgi:hypothetical protein
MTDCQVWCSYLVRAPQGQNYYSENCQKGLIVASNVIHQTQTVLENVRIDKIGSGETNGSSSMNFQNIDKQKNVLKP